MEFIIYFCIYSMIFFFIVLLKNLFSGGGSSHYKYKGMTDEEIEEYCKRRVEETKRNVEEWEELKRKADIDTARIKKEIKPSTPKQDVWR